MLELYHALYSTCALAEKQLEWQSREVRLDRGEHLEPAYLAIRTV